MTNAETFTGEPLHLKPNPLVMLDSKVVAVRVTLDGKRRIAYRAKDLKQADLFAAVIGGERRFWQVVRSDYGVDVVEVTRWVQNSLATIQLLGRVADRKASAERAKVEAARMLMQPHDHQEAHAETDLVEVAWWDPDEGATAKAQFRTVRRRVIESQLWDNLTPDQQRAAGRIYSAYRIVTNGLGAKTAQLERLDRGHAGMSDEALDLIKDYWDWHRGAMADSEIGRRGLEATLKVICEGLSLREADKAMRVRKGSVAGWLREALDLFVEIKGWNKPRPPRSHTWRDGEMPSVRAAAASHLTGRGS